MESLYVNLNSTIVTLHEGWLEHKFHHESKWKKVWLLLEGRKLYLHYSQNITQESPFATLSIAGDFKFEKRDGPKRSGYKFDIIINKTIYKLKASKFSEREQWRAFLEGVATGKVSDNIDLPSDYLSQIRLALKQLQDGSDSIPINQHHSDESEYAYSSTSGSFTTSEFDDTDSGVGDPEYYLEPHPPGLVFYADQRRTELPSWFFPNCSRELAVEILHKGIQYGNTLMRKGAARNSNLVISKKMETGKESFTHYEVVTFPDGYKLNVENPHRPMRTLTAIMNFFVQTSGFITTAPLTCNNLQKIGISTDHDYNPCIISTFEQSLPDLSKAFKPSTPLPKQINIWSQQIGGASKPIKSLFTAQRAAQWNQRRSQSIPDLNPGILKLNEKRKMSADFITVEAVNTKTPPSSLTTQIRQAHIAKQNSRSLDVPPPPPLNPPPQLKTKNNVTVTPPALPPNHPPKLNTPPVKKQLIPSTAVSTPALHIQSPLAVQRPVKNDNRNTQSLIGDVSQDNEFQKEEDDKVIYAEIRKKKSPLRTSQSVPLSYENWDLPRNWSMSDVTSSRLSSSIEIKTNYIELDPDTLTNLDFKHNYEPIDLVAASERMSPSHYEHQRENNKAQRKISSSDTYELSESIFEDRIHNNDFKYYKYVSARDDVFHGKSIYSDTDNLDNSHIYTTEYNETENKNYGSKSIASNNLIKRSSDFDTQDGGTKSKHKLQEEENVYEVIHSNTNETSVSRIEVKHLNGISTPREIYKGVEWKHNINRPKIPLPQPRRRTNSLILKTEKAGKSTTKKASTLNALDSLKSNLCYFDDKHYDEVLTNNMPSRDQKKCAPNYIDVIVNYEDIRAARISQKILAGSKNPVLADDFRKKLSEILGDGSKSNSIPAIRPVKTNKLSAAAAVTTSMETPNTTESTFHDDSDSTDGYQNAAVLPQSIFNNF